MQALSHAHHLGAGGRLLVYRLYLRHTVEERLLTLSAERKRSLSSLIRPAAGRSSLEVGRCTSSCVVCLCGVRPECQRRRAHLQSRQPSGYWIEPCQLQTVSAIRSVSSAQHAVRQHYKSQQRQFEVMHV